MCLDTIGANDIDMYIGKNNIKIIDLRNNISYKKGHIATAINIPYREVECNHNILPKCCELILYCDRGTLSLLLGRALSKEGYNIKSVYGGISAYRGKLVKYDN